MIPIDHVRRRFLAVKWTVLFIGIALPILAWIVSRKILQLSILASVQTTLLALLATAAVFVLANNYVSNYFGRAYVEGETWDFLMRRFSIARKPTEIDSVEFGYAQFDREDVVFDSDCGVSSRGIYLNVHVIGRLFVPWQFISTVSECEVVTNTGSFRLAKITLSEERISFCVPGSLSFRDFAPDSVGLSY